MIKKIFVFLVFTAFLLLLASSILPSTSSVLAYGENCAETRSAHQCRGNGETFVSTCQNANPICRCSPPVAGGPNTRAFCAKPATFEDCSIFADKTWVGIFKVCMNLGEALNTTVQWGIILAGVAAMIRLVMGGILFITATGDPKKIEAARETLTNAVLGLALILIAWVIAQSLSSGFAQYGLPINFLSF